MTADETYTHDAPSFAELLASLAGGTTFREPVGGRSTQTRMMPWTHELAAIVAYARTSPNDIGPDIAVAIATGNIAHREKIVTQLAAAMLATGGKLSNKHADFLLEISAHAYLHVVTGKGSAKPDGIRERDYLALVWDAECRLLNAAEETRRIAQNGRK